MLPSVAIYSSRYVPIPIERSVFALLDGVAHRLVCHTPLHAEFRTRNVIMNEVRRRLQTLFRAYS